MIGVRVFEPSDLLAISAHEDAAAFMALPPDRLIEYGEALAAHGGVFTGWVGDEPIFCGGAIIRHAEAATVWAVLAPVRGRKLKILTRMVRDYLSRLPQRRVDTFVRADFTAGHRWVARLGFLPEPEAVLGDYFADGQDAYLYRLETKE